MVKDTSVIIETEGLSKIYSMGKVQVSALENLSLHIPRGTFLGVTGPSGSGKSTLLNLIGGLDTPTSGTIKTQGKDVSGMSNEELALYRRINVGMIFQSFNLISFLTAVENVALPLLFSGIPKKQRKKRALEVLRRVGLSERGGHRPLELSGGEQQRVAIARALVNEPEILLTDEPTGNLDSRTSEEIVQMLADLNKNKSITVIMVSHEERLLKKYSDAVVHLQDGKLVRQENIR